MNRKKKNSAEEREIAMDLQAPTAVQQHTVVTKYVKEVPVSSIEAEEIEADDDDEDKTELVVETGAVLDQPSEIQAFIEAMGGSSDRWEMDVYRLPNYARDGRIDPQSRKRCGRFNFTQEYEVEVQRRWARQTTANDFLVIVKRNGRYVLNGTMPVFSCEPAQAEDRIAPPVQQPGQPMPQVIGIPYDDHGTQQVVDPMQQLKGLLQMQKMMREAMGPVEPSHAPLAQEKASPLDLEVILAKNDRFISAISNSAIGKIMGNAPEQKDEWADVAKDLIKSGQAPEIIRALVQSVFQGFGTLMPMKGENEKSKAVQNGNQDRGVSSATEQGQLEQGATASDQAITNSAAQNDHSAINAGEPIAAYQKMIADVLGFMEKNDPVDTAVSRVNAFLFIHPEFNETIDQTFGMDAPQLIATIGSLPGADHLPWLPHSLKWVEEFQSKFYSGEEDKNEQDTSGSNQEQQ